MLLLERLVSIYAPFCCLGCDVEEDTLLCDSCTAAVARVPSRCYHCRAVTRGYAVCERCRKASALRHVYVAVSYDTLAKELLHTAKYERARRGLDEVTDFMSPLLRHVEGAILVPVPTATSRVRQRGYDQAVDISKKLARSTRLETTQMLARLGQAHQVGSGRAARIRHLDGAFRLRRARTIQGAHIILVDDVVTSGATLEAAAKVLKKAGARQVDAVVFAQPD